MNAGVCLKPSLGKYPDGHTSSFYVLGPNTTVVWLFLDAIMTSIKSSFNSQKFFKVLIIPQAKYLKEQI